MARLFGLLAFCLLFACGKRPVGSFGGVAAAKLVMDSKWPTSKRWTCLGVGFANAKVVEGRLKLELADARKNGAVSGAASLDVYGLYAEFVVAFRTTASNADGDGELQFWDVTESKLHLLKSFPIPPSPDLVRDDCVPVGWGEEHVAFPSVPNAFVHVWSWNGSRSEIVAWSELAGGDYDILDPHFDPGVDGHPTKEWPHPVWVLRATFIPK